MRKVLILLLIFFSLSVPYFSSVFCSEGFGAETCIRTPDGYQLIADLKIGDIVIGYDPVQGYTESRVLNISKQEIDAHIEIVVDNCIVHAAPNQRFYLSENGIWVEAKDLTETHLLMCGLNDSCIIQSIENREQLVNNYAITVENNNFFIGPRDILVHNADVVSGGIVTWMVGRVLLRSAVQIIVGAAINIVNTGFGTKQALLDGCNFEFPKSNELLERDYYEKRELQLQMLRDDFLKIKNELEKFIALRCPKTTNFTESLLHTVQLNYAPFDQFLQIARGEELNYNDDQKLSLKQVRQAKLDCLEQQIFELQLAIGFHFNELIYLRDKAVDEFYIMEPEFNASINVWNSAEIKTNNMAISAYEVECLEVNVLQNIENRNQELKLAIQYYKSSNHTSLINKTTNISALIVEEEKRIYEIEHWLVAQKDHNANKYSITMQYFGNNNLIITNLKNLVGEKIKKHRETIIKKELEEAKKRRASIEPPEEPEQDKEKKRVIRISKDDEPHIFRQKAGHLPDTPKNRQDLIDLASSIKNFLGLDQHGTEWYAKIIENGKQLWATVRNELIRNGGMNDVPLIFNPKTGLSQLFKK